MTKNNPLNEYIRKTESKNDVQSILYKNIHVWLSLRNHIYARKNKGFFDSKANAFRDFFSLLKNSTRGFKYWFASYKYWYFSSIQAKRLIGNQWKDIYLDHINTELGKGWTLEYTTKGHFPKNRSANKRISSQIPIIILEKICKSFFLKKKLIKEIQNGLLPIIGEIELSHLQLSHHVYKMYFQYVFLKFILKIKRAPRLAFVVASYNNFGFIKALKEYGVKVIEVQHGVISNEHYGYHIYSEFPENYFPDYLLSFGQNNINDGLIKKLTIIHPVGSYIIDQYNNKYSENERPTLDQKKKYERVFSVALQDCETGMQLLPILIEIAKKYKNFQFILKPRRTTQEYYEEKYELPFNVCFSDWNNIYELIIHSDYHLSAYSSTSIEAPALGVANILFNINNKARSYYENQLKEGINTFYIDHEDDFSKMDWTQEPPDQKSIRESHSHIIKSGYNQNIESFLEKHK